VDRIDELLQSHKVPLIVLLLGIVLVIGGVFTSGLITPAASKKEEFPKESLVENTQISEIKVDVSGAVKSAGVYALNKENRVEDALIKAGGLQDSANQEYISKNINLSQKLTDGMKIYIPFKGEKVGALGTAAVAGAATVGQKVSINSGSQAELEGLSGVGAVTATKIIESRPYSEVSDLINKKIVGKALFEKIKDDISL